MNYEQVPGNFFSAFKDRFENLSRTSPSNVASALGIKHTEFAVRGNVTSTEQEEFANILNQAYSEGAMSDAKSFLGLLSNYDLSCVQKNHGLADIINVEGLSSEEAYNLLLPFGYANDINHNGLVEVGASKTIQFPPPGASPELLSAWEGATKNMSWADKAVLEFNTFVQVYGFPDDGILPAGGQGGLSNLRNILATYLSSLEKRQTSGENNKEYIQALENILKSNW